VVGGATVAKLVNYCLIVGRRWYLRIYATVRYSHSEEQVMESAARRSPKDENAPSTARRGWVRTAGGIAVGAALTAGVIPAVAAATSSVPVIYYACVKNNTGALKIVTASTRCGRGQRKISWNKTGPAGPPGLVTGHIDTNAVTATFSTSGTTIGTLRLPPGKFLVTASFYVGNLGGSADAINCKLIDGAGSVIDQAYGTVSPLSGDASDEAITLQGANTVAGKVRVDCASGVSTDRGSSVVITAVPVASLVSSTG
jgi:hypothetical protein